VIDWTGERCVPWAPDVQVVYEHLHRYLWASRIVSGRRVLDLGSGEGYGSAILAETAAHVIGVDVDAGAVEHSQLNYVGDGNLEFRLASATDLSQFADGSFDVVVAFEVIEHVGDHDQVFAELGRVLAGDGVLVLSTPERRLYSELPGYANPFHVREFTLDELSALLAREFANTAVWAQHVVCGSVIASIDPRVAPGEVAAATHFFVERSGAEWSSASAPVPVYVIAVASNAQLPDLAVNSTLADCGLELIRDSRLEAASADANAKALQEQLASALSRADSERDEHQAALDDARTGLEGVRAGYEAQLESARSETENVRVSYEAEQAATAVELAGVRDGYEAEIEATRVEIVAVRDGYEAQMELDRAELAHVRERYESQIAADEQALAEAVVAEKELRALLEAAQRRARDGDVTLAAEIPRLETAITAERSTSDELRAQLVALRDESDALQTELHALGDRLVAAEKTVRRVDESVTWRALQRLRTPFYDLLGGDRSRRGRAFGAAMRSVGRLRFLEPEPTVAREGVDGPSREEPADKSPRPAPGALTLQPTSPQIDLPVFAEPSVSLIIPLHAGTELTRACLESIRDNTAGVSYEVILVDDDADQQTKQLLAQVRGAKIIVNETNSGYLRSINRGATVARGRWLVLCNNDIQVEAGWLRAMKACAESAPDIGAVAPKYIYPDGMLNEAGAIIWRDGTGVNYGRGDDPQLPAYNYRRQVDYGSAAALLVRAELFARFGGYDERYAPMYYEDADLCFQLRQAGFRVMYEPEAVVVHLEGGTAGTDPASGHKRYQEQSRLAFVSKWTATLTSEHLAPSIEARRRAADRLASGHVLVIDHVVPMWDRDAGSVRMLGMISALREVGFQVLFLPDNFASVQPYARLLGRMGVEVLHGPFDVYGELRSCGPLLKGALLSRPTVAPRWLTIIRELAPKATVVYDTVDLHWIREGRGMAVNGASACTAGKVEALRELELAMVRASDATLVATNVESHTLESEVPDARICVVPMLHEVAALVPPVTDRSGIIFLGSFAHPPNIDAVKHLMDRIMPLVWHALPDITLTVVGSDPPPELLALQGDLVKVTGWVEDVDSLLHASRLMVAPLRFGAGMKGKVTQSLALGLPVVTSVVGAEGLEVGEENGLIVAEDPGDVADAIIRICTDDDLWQHLSRCGQSAMTRTCSPAIARDVFRVLFADTAGAPAHAPV